ncbi:leishmanolysin-related zinc metalloendopeptidase [Hasllibacter halocynthiae]|uniref:leishmanolysin-related zinc metalloendopeptidase n=1 Tax=Hasllibacter halocynthiae TaxID=595589 RepID=UPI001304D5FB|nr:leishmanolysin-related zinc metalloendopeptidase [Hasllibacter halocynthiae]
MIDLRLEGAFTPARTDAFKAAAARWDALLDTSFPVLETSLGPLSGLRIEARVAPLDGPEGVLGQAGPTLLHPGDERPVAGIMEFDSADLGRLEAEGSLSDVILHEMGHVLGFGTLFARRGLVEGSGGLDPRFTGAAAGREWHALEGADGAGAPLANTGGAGTREGHWRELVLGDELLTGFLSGASRPISRLSLAAFEDLGYRVDYARADPYRLPDFRALVLMGVVEAVRSCELCRVLRPIPRVVGEG